MTKHKGARGIEVFATFFSVVLITVFAVLPQFITLPRLWRIKDYARLASENIQDEYVCRDLVSALCEEVRNSEFLLLLVFSSTDVSDLELATDRATELCENMPDRKELILNELCNIYSAADTLAEKEHLTLSNVF